MAPALTPAEILARRKNYATSVIQAQNPPKTPKKDAQPKVAETKSKRGTWISWTKLRILSC